MRRTHLGRPAQAGLKRSVLVEGYGIPLGRVLAGANRHDSPLLGRPPTGSHAGQ
jgi:hypothetical protein